MRNRTGRWWLAASLAATLVGGGLIAAPAQAANGGKTMDQYTYELRFDRLDGPKAYDVPPPASGVRYVRFEFKDGAGPDEIDPNEEPSALFLGSDGRFVGSGPRGLERAATITKAFPGERFLDWADEDFITVGGRFVTIDPSANRTCFPPPLPPGDKYVSFLGGSASTLLTAQNRIVYYTRPSFYGGFWEASVSSAVRPCPGVFVSKPGLYLGGQLGANSDGSALLFLFRANGKVDVKTFPWPNEPFVAAPKIPKLPKGTKYVAVAASPANPTVLLRSDGRLVYLKGTEYASWTRRPQPPTPPAGMKYVDVQAMETGVLVTRSDGDVVLLDVGDTSHQGKLTPWARYGPDQEKGLRYRLRSGWLRSVFLFERIPAGQVVPSGVAKVTVPKRGVVRGKTARVKVRVVSKALLRGGLVRVTYKDKTIGKSRIKNSATVTVRIKTKRLHATGKNTIKVQYLGHGQAKRSAKAKATIKTRRR